MFNKITENEFNMLSRYDQATHYNKFAEINNLQPIAIKRDPDTEDGYKFIVVENTPKERRFIHLLTVGKYIKNTLLNNDTRPSFFQCEFNLSA